MQRARGACILSFMSQVHSLSVKWLPVSIAPADGELEVCVMDKSGIHTLLFPVRKSGTDWVDASTKKRVDIGPTHWRLWRGNR
jgi:hypothetical protein